MLICLVLLLINPVKSWSQTTIQLNLPQILDSIESSYPDLKKYDERIKSFDAKAAGAKSLMPPQITVGLNQFPYNTMLLKEKESVMNQAAIMVGAEQMFTNPVKLNRKRDYYLSLTEIEEKNFSWTKNQLFAQAKAFYYKRLIAEKKLSVLRENQQTLSLLVKLSKNKFTINQADLASIYKSEAKLSELANMRAMLNSQVAESNINLRALMNKSPGFHFSIDTLADLNSAFPSLVDSALVNRSDIQSMQNTIRSMGLNLRYMASSNRPDFGVRIEHMQMLGMPNQYSVMGMITVPIAPWSSGMYKSDVKSMQHEINAMEKEKETMLLMAKQMLNEKLSMFNYQQEQVSNFEKSIIPSFQRSFDAGLLAYRQNTGNLFILLDSWEMLLMKRMDYLDKYLELLLLMAEIDYQLERK